jgi:phosphoribosylformylglycinamidine synthase
MTKPNVLILTGYGINCDEETKFAFEKCQASADIVHINDLIENPSQLQKYQIITFAGGFSYGDDTGSGKALANRIKNNLSESLLEFIERDTLVLGICNGFQVMINLGLAPALEKPFGYIEASLEYNKSNRYQCRWVDLKVDSNSPCVFTQGIDVLHIPVAHGEGNYYANEDVLSLIENDHLAPLKYAKPVDLAADNLAVYNFAEGEFPYNPNGAVNDIAAICTRSGRVMGMMPHPERGMLFTQRDDWTFLKEKYIRENVDIPEEADGIKIFKNAVNYFS